MLNRRMFLQYTSAFSALSLVELTGGWSCNQQSIAQLVQTLGNLSSQIAAIEGNTTLASQLLTDTAAAVKAINEWKAGSPGQMAIQALNIVLDDLSLFPATTPYLPLIDLAIVTAESILALLPAPAVTAQTRARVQRRTVQATGPVPKNAKEFKKQANAIIAQHPGWKVAPLQ